MADSDRGQRTILSSQIELTEPFEPPRVPPTSSGARFDEMHLLVRVGAEPLGFVELPLDQATLNFEQLEEAMKRDLAEPLRSAVGFDGEVDRPLTIPLSVPEDSLLGTSESKRFRTRPVSVAVCTRNRAHLLPACLDSLSRLQHDDVEIIVVDNAPSDGSTREVVEATSERDPRFRYAHEPAPGLSMARNRALAEAKGDIIAFTDDDVRADPLWLQGLLRGFDRRGDVGCVTGMVASASLEHPAEQYFDQRVWWSSSCEPGLFDLESGPTSAALHPYAAGALGTGANFAAEVELLRRVGGFDECLGAGSPTAGGEDLDAFVRILRAGRAIAYEPAALVWHVHRMDRDALRQQMYEYGKALSAYIYKYIAAPRTRTDVLRRVPQGLSRLVALGERSQRAGERTGFSRKLIAAEAQGMLAGPWAYRKARRAQPGERRRAVAP